MKRLTAEQVQTLEFNRAIRGVSIKNTDVFLDESDMIVTLGAIATHRHFNRYKGTAWAEMCRRAVQQGIPLSGRQLIQARRQSASVVEFLSYLAHSNDPKVNDENLNQFYQFVRQYNDTANIKEVQITVQGLQVLVGQTFANSAELEKAVKQSVPEAKTLEPVLDGYYVKYSGDKLTKLFTDEGSHGITVTSIS